MTTLRYFINWIIEQKNDIVFCFNNYFINCIPFWPVRRFFYCLQGMKIGKKSRILMKTHIVAPQNIIIGDNTYVNEYCLLDGRGGITIGDNVTIALHSKLITGGHDIDDDFSYKEDRIYIGNHVAIFSACVILSGALIEEGCVFSAGAIVRKGKYRKNGLYAGNPAKYIRERKSKLNYEQNFWHPIFR